MTVKQLHELAYRKRMGLVGVLQSCVCTWPLEIDETTGSGHASTCPAHFQLMNRYVAGEGWQPR